MMKSQKWRRILNIELLFLLYHITIVCKISYSYTYGGFGITHVSGGIQRTDFKSRRLKGEGRILGPLFSEDTVNTPEEPPDTLDGLALSEDGDSINFNIHDLELCDEIGSSFMKYALSIILGRALPDTRDGLKVVHRRILWAMHMLRLSGSAPYRKCAKVVGDVLGNYHPHSDKSVYDALCRMSQKFVMRVPLIDGHGNFGSADDPPAAMRYTECRLSHFSDKLMLSDIGEDTVDTVPNFDSSEVEPLVLPSKVPSLLINGSSGIAVGLATNIPPHNPDEIISAAILMAKNRGEVEIDELLKLVKGPDFPTGGIISTTSENLKKIYTTGKGSLNVEARFMFEERLGAKVKDSSDSVVLEDDPEDLPFTPGSKVSIIVTEIPYGVRISDVILSITKGIKNGTINGIGDIRDESDRSGIRLVIELKRQVTTPIEIEEVIKQLKLQTELSSYFKCNFIALDKRGTKPIRFTLQSSIKIWLDFRLETIRRRTNYLLNKAKNSLHIVKGFIIATELIDDIIKMVKRCNSVQEVRTNLSQERYGSLSLQQIDAVLKMTLAQLSKLETDKFLEEERKLNAMIEEYKKLLLDDKFIYSLIINELEDIQKNSKNIYGLKRRFSMIVSPSKWNKLLMKLEENAQTAKPTSSNICDASLIILNNRGWLQRIKLDRAFYNSTKSRSIYSPRVYEPPIATHSLNADGTEAVDDDIKLKYALCKPSDIGVVIGDKGLCLTFPINKLRLCKRGYLLWKALGVDTTEKVSVFNTIDPNVLYNSEPQYLLIGFDDGNLSVYHGDVLLTKQFKNDITKTCLWKSEKGLPAFALVSDANSDILIVTEMGNSLRIRVAELVCNMGHRHKRSLRVINLKSGDSISNGAILKQSEEGKEMLLLLSQRGKGKLLENSELRVQQHGGRGYNLQRTTGDDDKLISSISVSPGQDILMVTMRGILAKKQNTLKPSLRHHKMKNFWHKITNDDLIAFSTPIYI